jgi:flagellar hook capping protein FlgD/LVIVD repeat-containing protein
LDVIDITNPASPQIVGTVDTPNNAKAVSVSGAFAYVATGLTGVQVIDIADPQNPRIVGAFDTPGSSKGVAVSEDYVYVADQSGGFVVEPVQCDLATNVGEHDRLASRMSLRAYPNPSSLRTSIEFSTLHEGPVQVSVYDVAGRRVRGLADGILRAGDHRLHWDGHAEDGRAVPGGIYLIRVSTPEGSTTARSVMVR